MLASYIDFGRVIDNHQWRLRVASPDHKGTVITPISDHEALLEISFAADTLLKAEELTIRVGMDEPAFSQFFEFPLQNRLIQLDGIPWQLTTDETDLIKLTSKTRATNSKIEQDAELILQRTDSEGELASIRGEHEFTWRVPTDSGEIRFGILHLRETVVIPLN